MFSPLLVPILHLHDDKVESVSKKKLFVLSLLCENFSEISNRKNDFTICITGDKNNHSLLTIHIKKMSPFMLLSQALKNFFERDIQPFLNVTPWWVKSGPSPHRNLILNLGVPFFCLSRGLLDLTKYHQFSFFLTKIGRSVDPLARPFTNVGPGSKEVEILFNANYHAKCEQFKTRFFLNVRYF